VSTKYTGNVTAEILWITPQIAETWLIRNSHNRNLNTTIVDRLARDIESSNFHLNGETIKISDEGVILDGQHRLYAVIESGQGIWSVVVRGLPLSSQESIDRVKVRNIADALRMRGETNANVLAGAISAVIVVESVSPGDVAKAWPTVDEALLYNEMHPEIRESIRVGENLSRITKTSGSIAAAMHHVFSKIDEEDANAFFDSLSTGANLAADSPINKLRDFMFREIQNPKRVSRTRLTALYTKAWNAYRAGKPMTTLRWATGGAHPEEFPRPQ
jgi:hypothetical protein